MLFNDHRGELDAAEIRISMELRFDDDPVYPSLYFLQVILLVDAPT